MLNSNIASNELEAYDERGMYREGIIGVLSACGKYIHNKYCSFSWCTKLSLEEQVMVIEAFHSLTEDKRKLLKSHTQELIEEALFEKEL